jgi:uncharacterized protein YgiM (DUF1202 family)
MKNNYWQHIGIMLTGIAAIITACVGVYDKIKAVHQEIYKPVLENTKKRQYGIVDDKDGWVNLRELPDVNSLSLAKILNGTNLEIIDKSENWFKVYTESGRIGYIFKDRLILVQYEKQ